MSQTVIVSPAGGGRRTDLDWVRIGAFALLIFYHCAVFYSPTVNMANSPRVLPWVQVPMLLTNPWRLLLLFIVSGAATRFMSAKLAPAPLFRARSARLIPPLIFGMLVVVPPQAFTQVIEQYGYHGDYLKFWGRYLLADHSFCKAGACLTLPTWNHLWFVAYLWLYTAALVALLAWNPRLVEWLQKGFERLLSGPGLIVWPVAYFASVRFLLEPHFELNGGLVADWYAHAIYMVGFLGGFLLARTERVWADFERLRWPALAVAIISYGLIIHGAISTLGLGSGGWTTVLAAKRHAVPNYGLEAMGALVWGQDQWLSIIAIFGFARRYLTDRDGPVRRYLTEAIFPFYIIHQTTIALVGHYLAKARLPLGLEAALLIGATIASCFATYELVRRIPWLRPSFGLKREALAPAKLAPLPA